MRHPHRFLLLAILAAGCASNRFPPETREDLKLMRPDAKLEVGLTEDGGIGDVEFHVPLEALPAAVRAAADRHMPGGDVVDCEKEYLDGVAHWEVTKRTAGKDQEILFDSTGTPVLWELEIDPSSAPKNVIEAADAAIGGSRTKVEEIRDAAKNLTAYHIKKDEGGIRYKIVLSTKGVVEQVYREMSAEIEVPIR
jgi:hypothetical protein